MSNYLRRTYDPYVSAELKSVLQHTPLTFDPIINSKVKSKKEFLDWLKIFHGVRAYQYCINSMKMKMLYKKKRRIT